MSNRKGLIAAIAIVTGVGLLLAWFFHQDKQIEKRGPQPATRVSAVIPLSMPATATAIQRAFNSWQDFINRNGQSHFQNKFPAESPWGSFFLFAKGDETNRLFPSDGEIRLDTFPDPELQTYYLAKSAELRKNDWYLYEPTGDVYWSSEYFDHNEPVKFRCSFIIHLENEQASETRVEIFEYQPTIWDGEKIAWAAHGIGPAKIHDIRTASPTTSDRRQVLELIEQASK